MQIGIADASSSVAKPHKFVRGKATDECRAPRVRCSVSNRRPHARPGGSL